MSAIAPAQEGGGSWLGALTPSKALALAVTVGYAVAQVFPGTVEYFALVPGKTIPFAWNLITAGYFEHRAFGLISGVPGLLLFGRLFEPVWGSREFLKFVFVVSFFSSVGTFMTCIILYYVTGHENLLYTPIAGLHAVLAGSLVAVKQIYPESDVLSATVRVAKLRAKWLPTLLVAAAVVLGFVLVDPIAYVPFLLLGTYVGWVYLRYFQRRSESSVTGDPSGEFSFRTFWPELLWPVVNPVAAWMDKFCCWGRAKQSGDEQAEELMEGGNPLPGSDPAEATRRRERGARALEERLVVSAATAKLADV